MTSHTNMKNGEAAYWPASTRRITQEKNAAVCRQVRMATDRAKEKRIKGRPRIWSGLKARRHGTAPAARRRGGFIKQASILTG